MDLIVVRYHIAHIMKHTTWDLYNMGHEHNIVLNTAECSPHLLNRRHTKDNHGEVYLSNTATLAKLTKGGGTNTWGGDIRILSNSMAPSSCDNAHVMLCYPK